MNPKRLLLLPALALLLFLGIYTWNQRTESLDSTAMNTGLEASGAVLKSIQGVRTTITEIWTRYLDLIGVREENELLKKQIAELQARLTMTTEDRAELLRLRSLLQLPPPENWQALGCRVLGRRIGPNSPLITITIGRGYLTGSTPETPVMTTAGVAGMVLRAGPHMSTALLLTDPGTRIAVITQKSRIQGILAGTGQFNPLELNFIPYNAPIESGELVVTSGMDGIFPKGLPVARVSAVSSSDLGAFLSVQATPIADLSTLEEVILLVRKPDSLLTPSSPTDIRKDAAAEQK